MTTSQNEQFERLLKTWNQHQTLRQQGAPVADLFASRAKLDDVRLEHFATAA